MPEILNIPELDTVDFDLETLKSAQELLRKDEALKLVTSTFDEYRSYRMSNQEPEWARYDSLYFGVREQKLWPNSNVPRSSIPWPITFEHVETAYAQIYESLFSQPEWFSVEAEDGVDPKEARAASDRLRYLLDHDKENFGTSAINESAQAIKNLLMYGNGVLTIEWNSERQRPIWSFVDRREIYTDPQARHPIVDYSRGIIRRTLMSIEQIKNWGNLPGADMPSDDMLYTLSLETSGAWDQSRDMQDAMRGKQVISAQQFTQYTPHRLIEVLSFWSVSKHVIILGGKHVFLFTDNPYGFIPYVMAPCYLIPGKLDGYSIPAVIEKNQRYIEGLLNARLDEISLALNPPRISKAGIPFSPTSRAFSPGLNIAVANPKDDVIYQQPSGVTNTALQEIDMITVMSEKLDGVNSHMSGVPRGGNANRTATGMTQQLQGGQLKMMMIVRNIEDYLLTPALYKTVKMLEFHDSNGNPAAMSRCKFKIYGSNKMLSREQIMQAFPFITQYLLNGTFLQQLSQQGKTVDFMELFEIMAIGTRLGRTFAPIRDLTPQEQQQLQQPPPEIVAQQQSKDKELQGKMQIEQMKLSANNNPQAEQMKLQIEAQKAQMDMQLKQMDLEVKKQLAQLEVQKQQMKMQLEQMQAQLKMQTTAQQAQLQSEVQKQQHEFTLQQQADQHAIDQQQAVERAAQERQQVAESNAQDLDFAEKSNSVKLQQLRMANPNPKKDKK